MKKNWFLILIIATGLAISYPFVFKSQPTNQVTIKDQTYKVEIADSPEERERGLSNRDHLEPNSGMLFIFSEEDKHKFWMKDTKIPLDIIWINDSRIVEMTTLQPQNENDIPSYTPENKANYVLEINANSGFKLGDTVQMKLNN